MGPVVILYQGYDPDLSHNLITSFFGQTLPRAYFFINFGVTANTNKSIPKHNLVVEI